MKTEMKLTALITFAVIAVPACLSSPSFGWWWQEKTNTVKAYDACVKKNWSPTLDWRIITTECIEKHAAPIPLDKIKGTYHSSPIPSGESYIVDRFFTFSAEKFVLTSVSAAVIVDGKEQTVSQATDRPAASLDVFLSSTIVERRRWPDAGPHPSIKSVTSAKGLEINID